MNSPRLMRDERGLALTLPLLIILGIIGLLGLGAASTINWKFLLAVMAMGIVGLAFVGVLFFHADFKMVFLAAVVSFGIIFIVEVSLPVIVGAIIVIAAMYYFKFLIPKRPLIFTLMVLTGLLVMVWGSKAVLLPMGIVP